MSFHKQTIAQFEKIDFNSSVFGMATYPPANIPGLSRCLKCVVFLEITHEHF